MNIARRFLLGRYSPGSSPLHLIDGRIKIIILILISLSIFMAPRSLNLVFPLAVLIFTIPFSGVKIVMLLKGLVPIIWLTAFTASVHIIFPPRNIEIAILMSGRILILFLWATLLTVTTSAAELASSSAWFLKPLRFTGISPEKTALSISMALRFFPLVLEEAESIIKAQKIRAEKLKPLKRIESFATAFMLRMLKKAEKVDEALKSRRLIEDGYLCQDIPTRFSFRDFAALMIFLVLSFFVALF